MKHPPDDPVDPSEVDATLKTPDPRSGWDRVARDPYGMPSGPYDPHEFFKERGYWPPGTPHRMHEDRKRRDYGDPPPTYVRGAGASITDTLTTAMVTLRQEMLRVGITAEMLLMASMDEAGPLYLGRELSYQLRAFVLREDQPPVTVKESKTVTVRIGQVSPATWRDHWKLTFGHRWWCRWWVARHPARVVDRPQSRHVKITAEFDLDKYRLYPLAPRDMVRRLGEPVQFVKMQPVTFGWSDPE